jgi:hypothetical protein
LTKALAPSTSVLARIGVPGHGGPRRLAEFGRGHGAFFNCSVATLFFGSFIAA